MSRIQVKLPDTLLGSSQIKQYTFYPAKSTQWRLNFFSRWLAFNDNYVYKMSLKFIENYNNSEGC